MDYKNQFTRRALAIIALLALLMGSMGATMYNLQIVRGDEFYAQSQLKIAETQTVEVTKAKASLAQNVIDTIISKLFR